MTNSTRINWQGTTDPFTLNMQVPTRRVRTAALFSITATQLGGYAVAGEVR